MQVYKLREMPKILAASDSGDSALNDYEFDPTNPLTW